MEVRAGEGSRGLELEGKGLATEQPQVARDHIPYFKSRLPAHSIHTTTSVCGDDKHAER